MASTSRPDRKARRPTPRDVVALFHASFHPTKGNVIDWCFKANDDVDLQGVEFKVLPSGLHTIEEDVVYFSHSVASLRPTSSRAGISQSTTYTGVSVFSRRPTAEKVYRGFRLEAVGVLLGQQEESASSAGDAQGAARKGKGVATGMQESRPQANRLKPWEYVSGLRHLSRAFSSRASPAEDGIGEDTMEGKAAREWFEAHRPRRHEETTGSQVTEASEDSAPDEEWGDDLEGWFEAFESGRDRATPDIYSQEAPPASSTVTPTVLSLNASATTPSSSPPASLPLHPHPLLQLPSLLLTLGPSSLTIFRYLLSQKRVLVLAKPPVEAVGVACWALASLASIGKKDMNVLGVVTLHDIDSLKQTPTMALQGWIACTTDTLFVEKTECWDLLVDLTSITLPRTPRVFLFSSRVSGEMSPLPVGEEETRGRARLYAPKASFDPHGTPKKSSTTGLTSVRFTWSDVKMWTHLTRIFQSYSYTLASIPTFPLSTPTSPMAGTFAKSRPPPGLSPSAALSLAGSTAWMDNLTKMYEDACILCAGMWFASYPPDGTGAIRLEGDDELRARTGDAGVYGRNKGMTLDGGRGKDIDRHERRRTASASTYTSDTVAASPVTTVVGEQSTLSPGKSKSVRGARRLSTGTSSMWSLPLGLSWAGRSTSGSGGKDVFGAPEGECSWEDLSGSASLDEDDEDERLRARREVDVTVAVLRAFQTHSDRLLMKLADMLAPHLRLRFTPATQPRAQAGPAQQQAQAHLKKLGRGRESIVQLTPKDLLALDLGPLSTSDARFVEWLADAHFVAGTGAGRVGPRVVVRKARWRDVIGTVFGFS